MRRIYFIYIAGLLLFVACNSAKRPSDINFANAINDGIRNMRSMHGDQSALPD
jgi:hypothetical protein